MELALPVVGAVPPIHFGVIAEPSTWNTVGLLCVAPIVARKVTVAICPVESVLFNVTLDVPLTFNVQSADAFPV